MDLSNQAKPDQCNSTSSETTEFNINAVLTGGTFTTTDNQPKQECFLSFGEN